MTTSIELRPYKGAPELIREPPRLRDWAHAAKPGDWACYYDSSTALTPRRYLASLATIFVTASDLHAVGMVNLFQKRVDGRLLYLVQKRQPATKESPRSKPWKTMTG